MVKRKAAAAAWVILCFGFFMVFRTKGMEPVGILFPGAILLYTVSGCLAVCAGGRSSRFQQTLPGSDRALFFILWGILLLAWLPAYLALFPGTFGYDVPEQMQQFFGEMPLTAHHPVLHTWLVGIFLQAGNLLFHSYQAGFAVFSLLQGMTAAGSIVCSLLFLKRRGIPLFLLLAGLAGCALNPILQILSFNATKDILFGAFFLYFMTAFLSCLEEGSGFGGKGLNGTSGCGRGLILSGVLMCLLRNQGIYIILALILFCILFRVRKGLIGRLGIVLAAAECFFLFVSQGLEIPSGDSREMLCVPMQQLAIVWQNRENADITPWQVEAVEELVEQEALYQYMPECADPVKSGFRTDVLRRDPMKYLGLYLAVGRQNPSLYGNALQALTLPYLDGSLYRVPETTMEFTFPGANIWGIRRHSLLPGYEAWLQGVVSDPLWVFLLQPGLAIYLLVILAGAAIAHKSSRLFLGILPGVLFLGTILLGSGALLRYLYPLMLAVPLLCGLLVYETFGTECR